MYACIHYYTIPVYSMSEAWGGQKRTKLNIPSSIARKSRFCVAWSHSRTWDFQLGNFPTEIFRIENKTLVFESVGRKINEKLAEAD